jgi:hypothetical protein
LNKTYRTTLRAHADALAALGRAYADVARRHRVVADAVARGKRQVSADSDFHDWILQACALTVAGERLLALEVELARTFGVTWDEIAAALGVSRQAAWERFAKPERWNTTRRLSQLGRARRASWIRDLRQRIGDDAVERLALHDETDEK